MKKIIIVITMMVYSFCLPAQSDKKITILHTNDLHSRLTGFAPESNYTPMTINDDNTVGGFARIATVIKKQRESGNPTIVVDAGDFLMGTLFPWLEVKTGFQLRLMKKMGYDIVGIGNHEYEFGPEWLASVIEESSKRGPIPALLIGNARFDLKNKRDDVLENEFDRNLLKNRLVINVDGLKVGFFSILGHNAVSVAPNAKPVTFEKQLSYARRMVKELKSENCNIIICVSHSGISKDVNNIWDGEDVDLAKAVKGIDLIIGGHSHTKLERPLTINGTDIIQAGSFGQYVGCITLSYSASSGKTKVDDYKLIEINDHILGDQDVNNMIEKQKAKIDDEILQPIKLKYDQPIAENDFVLEGNDGSDYVNSNIGPFIADAIYYYVNRNSKIGTDVSMVAAGMIFDRILPGKQTAPDIFRVVPLGYGKDSIPGYALTRIFVTGRELKNILEILLMAGKSDPEDYCYYSGIRVEYNPEKGLLNKISKIELISSDGKIAKVDLSKKNKTLYSLTADSYMLGFIGIIKKRSFGLINVVPKDASGNKVNDIKGSIIDIDENKEGIQEGKEWLALIEYMKSMKDTNGNNIPEIDSKYKIPQKCFYIAK